jgi:hypothetical protein
MKAGIVNALASVQALARHPRIAAVHINPQALGKKFMI